MDTKIWGPHAWNFLHSVALAYPEKPSMADRNAYYRFFQDLGSVLPCHYCKLHYSEHFVASELTAALESRQLLFEWTVHLHNKVNKALRKPTLSVKEALQELQAQYSETTWELPFKPTVAGGAIAVCLIMGATVYLLCTSQKKKSWVLPDEKL